MERGDAIRTYVSEEGGDGEGTDSEVSSLMLYTLKYISLVDQKTSLVDVVSRDTVEFCP